MTNERKRWLTEMVDREAMVIVEATGRPTAILQHTSQDRSVADAHLAEDEVDFIIERSYSLARPRPR